MILSTDVIVVVKNIKNVSLDKITDPIIMGIEP